MKLFITTLSLLFFTFTAAAQESEVYEYLTMIKVGNDLHVSLGSSGYEKVDIRSEMNNSQFDLSAVNKRTNLFEAEGWEFVSADHTLYGGSMSYWVVMRRSKE